MAKQLSLEDGQNALKDHAIEKAMLIVDKYGHIETLCQLESMLKDSELIRFPVEIKFLSEGIESGTFGLVEKKSEIPSDGYLIILDARLSTNPTYVIACTSYLLVSVNYGDFASFEEAEIFGSIVTGIPQEEYYELLCHIVDTILV